MQISPENAQALINQSKENKSRRDEKSKGRDTANEGPPVAYLNDGSYKLRVYPEEIDGKLVVVSRRWVYQYRGLGIFPHYEGSVMESEAARATSNDSKGRGGWAWKYQSREIGLVKAVVYETDPPGQEYITYDKPQILVLKPRAIYQFDNWLAGLNPGHLVEILDIDKPSFLIKLDWQSGARGSCNVSILLEKRECPPLKYEHETDEKVEVRDFPSIVDCYVKDRKPTEEEARSIQEMISKEIMDHSLSPAISPSSDNAPFAPPAQGNGADSAPVVTSPAGEASPAIHPSAASETPPW